MSRYAAALIVLSGVLFAGCLEPNEPVDRVLSFPSDTASAYGGVETLSPEEIEGGRLDDSWKRFVVLDSTDGDAPVASDESWDDITPEAVNTGKMALPLGGDVAGPSVFRTQILLDRAGFSPGVIDGRWGKNTEKAVFWLQKREGLRATGRVDTTTFRRLMQLANNPDSLVQRYTLTADDVKGPFEEIPEDIYEKAEMERLYYESLGEKLSEMFHTSRDLLAHLNPEASLDSLNAGVALAVPNLERVNLPDSVARVVISDGGNYLHAVDAGGRILYHFPSTLGSSYDPSPTGDYHIVSVTEDPWWHYQPAILANVPDSEKDARIPPGPNNAVGKVWIALSKEHYGIHGTSAPETIGYATSAGCVRLTNWDALFLADRVKANVPVEFRDSSKRSDAAADGGGRTGESATTM